MNFGWKVLLPVSLATVFITAVGILLADQTGNPMWMWLIPATSLVVFLIPVIGIYRALRRLSYGRA
jgi:NADH:ubiquinone oxidoreductase subunit H